MALGLGVAVTVFWAARIVLPGHQNTLPSSDRLEALRAVDWSKASVVQKYGRGKATMKIVKNGISINFDDPDPGVDFYAIKISFSPSDN